MVALQIKEVGQDFEQPDMVKDVPDHCRGVGPGDL